MIKEVVTEYLKVNREFTSSLNNNTVTTNLTPVTNTALKQSLAAKYAGVVIHSQLICQSIDVRAAIDSVAEFTYPDTIFDGITPSVKANTDLLKALWTQPRRELNLWQQLDGTNWIFRGAVALPNRVKSGAYYYEQMLSILTDREDYPCQQNEVLGIQLAPNTWGLLATNDKILVTLNWELRHTLFE